MLRVFGTSCAIELVANYAVKATLHSSRRPAVLEVITDLSAMEDGRVENVNVT